LLRSGCGNKGYAGHQQSGVAILTERLESSFDMPFRRRENGWLGEYFDADVLNEHGSEIGSVKIGKPGAACAWGGRPTV